MARSNNASAASLGQIFRQSQQHVLIGGMDIVQPPGGDILAQQITFDELERQRGCCPYDFDRGKVKRRQLTPSVFDISGASTKFQTQTGIHRILSGWWEMVGSVKA